MCRCANTGAGAPAGIPLNLRRALESMLSHRAEPPHDRAPRPPAGDAHRLIFYGFVLLFLGTATITLDYDILGPLFGVHFWHGTFYLWFSLVLDVAGVMLIGGLLYMMYRRGWIKPPEARLRAPGSRARRSGLRSQQLSPRGLGIPVDAADDRVTGYLLEALRLVWLQGRPDVWDTRWWSPVGAALAQAFAPPDCRLPPPACCGRTCGGSTDCWHCCSSR